MAKDGRVLIAATVTDTGEGPYLYPACKQCYSKLNKSRSRCNKTVNLCNKCSQEYTQEETEYRFRLCLSVTDSSTIASVTAFGGILSCFFGVPATTFHHIYESKLREKYGTASDNILKVAVQLTFMGQNLIFGFKLSRNTIKQFNAEHSSHQRYISLKDICSSAATASQTTSASQVRSLPDLIAVQVLRQADNASFMTVVENLYCIECAIEQYGLTPNDCLDRTTLQHIVNLFVKTDDFSVSVLHCQSFNKSRPSFPASPFYQRLRRKYSSVGFSCDSSIDRSLVMEKNCAQSCFNQDPDFIVNAVDSDENSSASERNVLKKRLVGIPPTFLNSTKIVNDKHSIDVRRERRSKKPDRRKCKKQLDGHKSNNGNRQSVLTATGGESTVLRENQNLTCSSSRSTADCLEQTTYRSKMSRSDTCFHVRNSELEESVQDMDGYKFVNSYPGTSACVPVGKENCCVTQSADLTWCVRKSIRKKERNQKALTDGVNTHCSVHQQCDECEKDLEFAKLDASVGLENMAEGKRTLPYSSTVHEWGKNMGNPKMDGSDQILSSMYDQTDENELQNICKAKRMFHSLHNCDKNISSLLPSKRKSVSISHFKDKDQPVSSEKTSKVNLFGHLWATASDNVISQSNEKPNSQLRNRESVKKTLSLKNNRRNMNSYSDSDSFLITDEYADNISVNVTFRRPERKQNINSQTLLSETLGISRDKQGMGDDTFLGSSVVPPDLLDPPESEDLEKFLNCMAGDKSLSNLHYSECSKQMETQTVLPAVSNEMSQLRSIGQRSSAYSEQPVLREQLTELSPSEVCDPQHQNMNSQAESANGHRFSQMDSEDLFTDPWLPHITVGNIHNSTSPDLDSKKIPVVSDSGNNVTERLLAPFTTKFKNSYFPVPFPVTSSEPFCDRDKSVYSRSRISNISDQEIKNGIVCGHLRSPQLVCKKKNLAQTELNSSLHQNYHESEANVTDSLGKDKNVTSSSVASKSHALSLLCSAASNDCSPTLPVSTVSVCVRTDTCASSVSVIDEEISCSRMSSDKSSSGTRCPADVSRQKLVATDIDSNSLPSDSFMLPNSSQDLFDSQAEDSQSSAAELSACYQHSGGLPRYVMKHQPTFGKENVSSSTLSLQHTSCPYSLENPHRRRKKVRFTKMRLEHHFFDFDIISHHPIVRQDTPGLRSCLKNLNTGHTDELPGSQDLFSDVSDCNDSSLAEHNSCKSNEWNHSLSFQLCSQSPRSGPASPTTMSVPNEIVHPYDKSENVASFTRSVCLKESASVQGKNSSETNHNLSAATSPNRSCNEMSFDLFTSPQTKSYSPCRNGTESSLYLTPPVGQNRECFTPDLFS